MTKKYASGSFHLPYGGEDFSWILALAMLIYYLSYGGFLYLMKGANKNMGVDLKGKDLGPNLSQRKKDGKYRARFITASGKRVDRIFDNVKEAKQWNGFKENNKRPNTVRNGNYPKLKKEIEPFATRFLESASGEYAKSYKMLSHMMEHSSIKITLDLYSHLTEETVKTEIDKFSNYMDRMVFA